MKTLIVGSGGASTANYYKNLSAGESTLVDSVDCNFVVGHTSPVDLSKLDLQHVMNSVDIIYWAHSSVEEFNTASDYYEFLDWLKDFNLQHNKIANLNVDLDPFNWQYNTKLDTYDIVFLGCSFTAGEGLSDPTTHYSSLVADHFGLNLVNLAENGASNSLSFDKFTQLDFCPGQVVVLQLTGLERLQYCKEDRQLTKIMFAMPKFKNLAKNFLEVYNRDFLFYENLCRIRAIVTIARLKKIKLIFWTVNQVYTSEQLAYFYNLKEFVPESWVSGFQVDLAEDNMHPGIESNKNIANTLIRYIETVYEI
jgi:hypothetical protein